MAITKSTTKTNANSKTSEFVYKRKCAFDRKCFSHKDITNGIFCNMLKQFIGTGPENKILCLDSSLAKTSTMLIDQGLTKKKNITLIEGNQKVYKTHILNGFNCIYGNCANVITTNLQIGCVGYDGIYLDAIGTTETIGQIVFDTVKNVIIKSNISKCILGYTFVRRSHKKGQTFISSYNEFILELNNLLDNFGYKISKSEQYSYGSPKTGQANMFTEFLFVEKL